MRIRKSKRIYVLLFVFVFTLSITSLSTFNYSDFDNNTDLEPSNINTLFNGKEYPFELKDVYDDEDSTKVYTTAYLQTEYNQNGTVFEDEVSVVNNTNYKSPSLGHYPATYSFEEFADGTEGYDITGFVDWYSAPAGTSAKIISGLSGSDKVIEMDDQSDVNRVAFYHDFDYTEADSTIEFWLASNTITSGYRGFYVYFYDQNLVNTMVLVITDSALRYHNGTSDYTIYTITANEFFHVKMVLDDTADTYDIYVNGDLKETDINYNNPSTTNVYRIYFATRAGNTGYKMYVDAVGYSGDPDYNEGDNFYPDIIDMEYGTFDHTDNIKTNDDSYTEFTSTIEGGAESSFMIEPNEDIQTTGWTAPMWSKMDGADTGYTHSVVSGDGIIGLVDGNVPVGKYVSRINIKIEGYYTYSGSGTVYISWRIGALGDWSSETSFVLTSVRVWYDNWWNDLIDFRYSDVNIDNLQIRMRLVGAGYREHRLEELDCVIYYTPIPAELDFTIDFDFSEVDTSKLLALEVSSFHFTDVSQIIIGNVYNYDSSSYTEMFSSNHIAETENYFLDESSVDDYLDGSGNLRLQFKGTNSDTDFKLSIDYIKVSFYYKMDIIIYKTFYINGIWRYRFKLVGSLHYTDWTVFEVIDPDPNFYAISESDLTTRWILQNATILAVEDFHDDINTDYWNLIDVSNINFNYEITTTRDSYVGNLDTDTNYGTATFLRNEWVDGFGYKFRSYVYFPNVDSNYLFVNQSGSNRIGLYAWNIAYSGDIHCNDTTTFSESTITWNNAPSGISLQDTVAFSTNTGYNYWDITEITNSYVFYTDETGSSYHVVFRSKEYGSSKPQFQRNDISKNYFGSGYMYMQTNITELISLKSVDYGTHKTLSSGDYFEVDFQTSSDSKIELILLKDGVVNKTLILSQSGNTNFNRHTSKISVAEDVEFDQLKISSIFEDIDNIKVHDIKTYKYILVGDHADFYVGSNRDYEVYLTPDIYNLRIIESDIEVINENITIPAIGVKQYVYTPEPPISKILSRLTLFPIDGILSLNFPDYKTYINRSYDGVYKEIPLVEPIFYADELTIVYISVYDRFDSLIGTFPEPIDAFINLEIEVYELEIINLMLQKTTIDINGSLYESELASGRWIDFMLSKAYYQIGYYDTNDVDKQFTIYLNSNQVYELNRSKICFLSYADQQGNHLYFDNYKTYLNGSLLYENVFYREIGDNIRIEIKDRYGISIKNETYTVISGDNYIPITLTMYSLKVMNQQEIFNWINITRDPNHYDSDMYWSEWIAPSEIIEFKLFAGFYKINLTNNEGGGSSCYEYTLNGDDVILISSGNLLSQVIYNIANVNTTIGNQITAIYINITNQNSNINNTIVSIEINIESMNSTLGNLLTSINLDIININNNISNLYTFTENNFLNLGNNINNSFTLIENNIIAINQTISTLVIGLDGKVTVVNATITTMFTEMNSQFVIVQSTLDFSFAFLNQTIIQIGNNITTNQIALNNLIIQRANEIDNSLIQISTLVNLINSSVVNESLVIQSLVNIIGNNITENHVIINDLINLIGNNITENNINMVSIIELVGNNITTNHFVIQTLIDYVSNNITDNHLEFLTNINLINNTIGQNQIELINRLLFINNSINTMALDLTNQILLVNNTIYSAILDVYTSIDFTSDNILGNISLTYQQNDFLTELYKETMFSQLLNWSDVAFNYSIMEDRIDVWEFINNYEDDAIIIHLKYQDLTDNLTISAQNSMEQYLPDEDVEYRLWSIANEEYLDEWKPLPESRVVILGFFRLECRLILSNIEGGLRFTDYHIWLNRSLNGVYNDSWILYSEFFADKNTYAYISIYDRFDALIDTFEVLITTPYISLELEVYRLQIKSLLEIATTLTINSTHIYPLLSGDSKYFSLLKAYYQIEYYDDNNNYKQFIVYLDSNQAYELNSTYFDVYFSIFNFDGLGLNRDLVRFYINGERRDFGFNILKRDVNNLKVLDFFNATIFDQNVNLGHCTEYNVLVEVYTLIINNNYTHSIRIVIERENSNIEIEQIIPAQYGMPYRFLPDIEYIITAYDLNGTKLDVKYVELDKNNKIVSFGFYSTEVPYDPEPLVFDTMILIAFIIIICVFGWIIVIAWAYMKKDRDIVPEDTRLRHKRKRKALVDRRKGFYDHT